MGLINIYNGIDNTHKTIHANGKIKDVLPDLKIDKSLCLKEGTRLDKNYEITEEDVIYVRMTPTEITATTLMIATIVTTVVATGVGIVVGAIQYNKNKALQDLLESSQTSSSSTTKLPFLKGANNQSALGKAIPYIMGEMYHTPYTLNNGFYSISGDNGENQKWNVELISGYSDQKLKSVSIGTTKIADYDETAYSQDGIKAINKGIYQTDNEDCQIEVCTNGELLLDGLNQKVVSQVYNEEVKHDYGEDAEPVIEQCAENVQRVEVCIEFNGLRAYEDSQYVAKQVKIVPYWTNNPDAENPTWNEFQFDVKNDGSATYSWEEMTDAEVQTAITNGYIIKSTARVQVGVTDYITVTTYYSNNSDYRVTETNGNIKSPSWKFEHKETTTSGNNIIVRNTDKTCRFVATKTFTASESYGKNISIKVVKETVTSESNTTETCILKYIQTWCYDAVKSTSTELVACRPLENPYRDETTRIGLSLVANSNTDNVLDEINIITCGTARTWNGSSWSDNKTVTRNPASWILELLTSDKHYKSQYLDSELDLSSFGVLYTYCVNNNFYTDGIITEGKKKRDIIESILSSVGADMILNDEGKLEIIIDQKETTPVALINSQNVSSINYAKSFERQITGLKTTYVDRNSWTTATEYFMRDGRTTYDQEQDTLTELALDYVTTHDHAYKVAQRQMRQTFLQPRTITVNVGLEGDFYPLYSTVLLQIERFKQGIQSATVHSTISVNNQITKIVLSDKIDFAKNTSYGIIVQAQNDNGKRLIYSKIKTFDADTTTDTVELSEPLESNTVLPEYNNICSIGLLNDDGEFDSVTNVMKITGVKPADNHGWELELKDYNEQIYEYGTIPEYKSNLTSRPTTQRTIDSVKAVDIENVKDTITGVDSKLSRIYSNHIVTLYKASSTVLSETGITSSAVYDFSSNSFTWNDSSKSNGWTIEKPTSAEDSIIYTTTATAYGKTTTDTIESSEWAIPSPFGQNGVSTRTLQLFMRAGDTPTNRPKDFVQDFYSTTIDATTSQLNGWEISYPAVDSESNPVWEIHVTVSSVETSITISSSVWSTPVKIGQDVEVTQAEIQEMINKAQKLSAPVVYADSTFGSILVDEDDVALCNQTVSTTIHVLQTDTELEFTFGNIEVPNGFTVTHDQNVLMVTVAEGTVVKSSSLKIPIIYAPYTSMDQYGDENGDLYGDEDGNVYGYYVKSDTTTTYNLGFAISQTRSGRYLKTISTISAIPSTLFIGDFFTWTGTDNTESSLSQDGVFLKGAVYKWNGYTWQKDTSANHIQTALKDIISNADSELSANNSEVTEFFKKIGSNEVLCNNLTVTGNAFIKRLQAVDLYANTFTSYDEKAQGYASTAQSNAENNAASDAAKKADAARSGAKSDVYSDTGLSTLTNKTIISGGKIKTDLIDASKITVGTSNFDSTVIENGKIKTDLITVGTDNFDSTVIEDGHIKTSLITVGTDNLDSTIIENDKIKTGLIDADNLQIGTDKTALSTVLSGKADSGDIPDVSADIEKYHKIYCQVAIEGFSAKPTAPETYITEDTETWKITKPSVSDNYYLFSCVQTKTVGGTVTNTTPNIDTDTVIDTADGFIKTDRIDVKTITAGFAKVDDLTSGVVTVKTAESSTDSKNVNGGSIDGMTTGSGTGIAIHSDDWTNEDSESGFGILKNGDIYANSGYFRGITGKLFTTDSTTLEIIPEEISDDKIQPIKIYNLYERVDYLSESKTDYEFIYLGNFIAINTYEPYTEYGFVAYDIILNGEIDDSVSLEKKMIIVENKYVKFAQIFKIQESTSSIKRSIYYTVQKIN